MKPPHHCAPSDYLAMIVRLQQIEAGELSPANVDWRTQAGVLWRMLYYATRVTDAGHGVSSERVGKGRLRKRARPTRRRASGRKSN